MNFFVNFEQKFILKIPLKMTCFLSDYINVIKDLDFRYILILIQLKLT